MIELVFVVALSLYANQGYFDPDPALRNHGFEVEWNNSTVAWSAITWSEQGYIPRWMPYIDRGMPSVDHGLAFLINPFASGGFLLFGPDMGMRVGIVVLTLTAGIGGVVLGRVLGWGLPARLLLGGLLIVRGAIQTTFGYGYYQLAGQQEYFSWVLAGIIGLARGTHPRRYVVLLALSMALLFHAGNIFYILPTTIMAGVLGLLFLVRWRPRLHVDTQFLQRGLLALILIIGLMAVTALSILIYYRYLGNHYDYSLAGGDYHPLRPFFQLFTADAFKEGLSAENYYNYVTPLWFLLVLLIAFPPVPGLFYRSADRATDSRVWLMLIGCFILFYDWGLETGPIIRWLWEQVPGMRQFRYPARYFAVDGFIFAVMLAYRFDGLWKAFIAPRLTETARARLWKAFGNVMAVGMVAAAFFVPLEVLETREFEFYLERYDAETENCLSRLRQMYPDELLSVYKQSQTTIYAFFWNHIRLAKLGADYDQMGRENTLFDGDLSNLMPAYAMLQWDDNFDEWRARGYAPLETLLRSENDPSVCFWYNPNAISYAFTVPVSTLQTNDAAQVEANTSPAVVIDDLPEYIAVRAQNLTQESAAVVVQTIAYPGWDARVNGQPAQLESVGQLLGVVLPPGTEDAIIEFIYTPRILIIGGFITIGTAIFTVLYLLSVDRRWRRKTPADGG